MRGRRALVLLTAAALTAAASAPAPEAGAAKAPTTTSGSTRGVTATSITVGGIGYGSLYADAAVGAKARFARENAAGGVEGRQINFTGSVDDQGDAQTDKQQATELVTKNNVFAVVPAVTPALSSSYLVANKVPYFGWALSSGFCGNQYGFGFTGCLLPRGGNVTSDAWGLLVAQSFGANAAGKTAALLTESTPSGQYELKALAADVAAAGLTVSYQQSSLPVPASTDFSDVAKQVMAANNGQPPDAVFVVGGYASVAGVQQALGAAGYHGVFTNQLEYDPQLVSSAAGASVMLQTAAYETFLANPPIAQLATDVHAVAPDQVLNQAVAAGYWSADLFIAALKRAGKNLTVQHLLAVANKDFTYEVPSTIGTTTFPAAHNKPTPCGTLVRGDGTGFTVTVPFMCGRVVPVK